MDTQAKVDSYLANHADKLMTTEKFWSTLVDKYDALRHHLLSAGVDAEDAADALQELAVWGGANDWDAWNRNQVTNAFEKGRKPDTRFAYRGMKLTMGWLHRNRVRDTHETAMGQGASTDLEPSELDGVLAFDTELDSMIEEWQAEVSVEDDPNDNDVSTDAYLACLTGKQQQVLVLRGQGLDQWDIAERCGIKRNTVSELLMRAYERLTEAFNELRVAYKVYDYKDDYVAPEGRPGWIITRFTGCDPYEVSSERLFTGHVNHGVIGLWPAREVQVTTVTKVYHDADGVPLSTYGNEVVAQAKGGWDYDAWKFEIMNTLSALEAETKAIKASKQRPLSLFRSWLALAGERKQWMEG